MTPPPRISVVVSTHNRRESLARALAALRAQCDAPPHEIIVVDNASTDGTRDLVRRLVEGGAGSLIYIQEPRQGLSHARNAGIAAARAPIVAFTDDDVLADPGWLAAIAASFARYPDALYIGGRVLPRWTSPPAWLTPAHWSPLALQDHGERPFRVDTARPLCLVGANMAFRADAFALAGGFSPLVQLLPGRVGSTEDHELMHRIWARGGHGVYDPAVVVRTDVQPERLSRRYHRRWHFAHGRSHARMRLPEMERSRGRVLDVPVHLVRQAALDTFQLLRRHLQRDPAAAFLAETRLWFVAGFVRERVAHRRAAAVRHAAALPPLPDSPLVSIVIPCYNQAAYLAEALESALSQSHSAMEVVVVDDGSTDETAAVAARYAGVRCVRQPNGGLARARNAGAAASRGDCLVFLDADDRLAPGAVDTGIQALRSVPGAALAFGRARVIGRDGEPLFTAPAAAVPGPAPEMYATLLRSNVVWTPALAIVRREVLESLGGFDPSVSPSADYELYLRIARHYRMVSHGAVVADYRHHAAAMSRDAGLMLRTTLAVHARQWPLAKDDPALARAWREGRQFWRRFFGDQLMDQVRAHRSPRAKAAGLLLMLRYAPGVLARHAGRWLRNRLRGRTLRVQSGIN